MKEDKFKWVQSEIDQTPVLFGKNGRLVKIIRIQFRSKAFSFKRFFQVQQHDLSEQIQ
ncbi:hypothetical protein HU147_01360 [Planomicrobium chinense]|uniref:hypothetical protein n=1 Tax=Planococcus chinensis TaxID=272917 RepID=UPI001CC800F8|nr:hypothetical protein [Planococcus chinensis]MBZ5199849.1 hypothetical protein [Planococcus chinensis]